MGCRNEIEVNNNKNLCCKGNINGNGEDEIEPYQKENGNSIGNGNSTRYMNMNNCLFPIFNGEKLSLTNIEKELLSMSLFLEINKIRKYPTSYIPQIEYFKKQIKPKTESNEAYIKVSPFSAVVLKTGEEAFDDCIEFLKKQKPLKPLNFENALKIDFPRDIKNCYRIDYISDTVKKKMEGLKARFAHNLTLKKFHFDINAPFSQASCALQVVDDTNSDQMRRKNIFNENLNVVHINCEIISRGIICYYMAFGEKL